MIPEPAKKDPDDDLGYVAWAREGGPLSAFYARSAGRCAFRFEKWDARCPFTEPGEEDLTAIWQEGWAAAQREDWRKVDPEPTHAARTAEEIEKKEYDAER